MIHFFISSLVLVHSFNASATLQCGNRESIAGTLFQVGDIYQKSSQTNDADRRTAEQFGRENQRNLTREQVERRYAATGDLRCPGISGQAQVTVRGDTVTTAAHVLYPTYNCKNMVPFRTCKFVLQVGGVPQEYRLKAVVKTGANCPERKDFNSDRDDWIIFRLEKFVDSSVKPYGIPIYGRGNLTSGQRIITVAKSNDWPERDRLPLRDKARHYAECTAQKLPQAGARLIQTDCDTSPGSSGGSVLTVGDDPILLGVVGGQITGEDKPKCKSHGNQSESQPYEEDCWASSAAAVEGEFKKAIMEATGLNDDGKQIGPAAKPTPNGLPSNLKLLPGLKF